MTTHLDNEALLVSEARNGCAESFTTLVKQYERQIYGISFAVTENPEDAEDVLQETFLKAYLNIGAFRGESRFYTWLVRIALNQSLMRLRRRHLVAWVSLDDPTEPDDPAPGPREIETCADNPEQLCANAELREILNQAIRKIDPGLRIVFLLRDVEGFSTEKTAHVLGLSVPTVKTRLMRSRLKLRSLLTKKFGRKTFNLKTTPMTAEPKLDRELRSKRRNVPSETTQTPGGHLEAETPCVGTSSCSPPC